RIEEKGGARLATPAVFPRRADGLRLGDIHLHGKPQTEAGALIGRLAETAGRYPRQVGAPGQVVQAHELQGLASDDTGAVEFSSIGQGLGEAVVVADGRDQPAATGKKAVFAGEVGGLDRKSTRLNSSHV